MKRISDVGSKQQRDGSVVPLSVLHRLYSSIGCIQRRKGFASGVVIAANRILTNYHVLRSRSAAKTSVFIMMPGTSSEKRYSLLPECRCNIVDRGHLDVNAVVGDGHDHSIDECKCNLGLYISNSELDYCIVSCEPIEATEPFGMFEAGCFDPQIAVGTNVMVAGHPISVKEGRDLQVSFGQVKKFPNNRPAYIKYKAWSRPGSSGGAVVSVDSRRLIAIHVACLYGADSHDIKGRLGLTIKSIAMDCGNKIKDSSWCLAHLQSDCEKCCLECVREAAMTSDAEERMQLYKRAASVGISQAWCPHCVSCPYVRFGCPCFFPRNRLGIHLASSTFAHLQLAERVADAACVAASNNWKQLTQRHMSTKVVTSIEDHRTLWSNCWSISNGKKPVVAVIDDAHEDFEGMHAAALTIKDQPVLLIGFQNKGHLGISVVAHVPSTGCGTLNAKSWLKNTFVGTDLLDFRATGDSSAAEGKGLLLNNDNNKDSIERREEFLSIAYAAAQNIASIKMKRRFKNMTTNDHPPLELLHLEIELYSIATKQDTQTKFKKIEEYFKVKL